MALELNHFEGPFRKVWSLVGRSLVVDRNDRQVVRPSDLGSPAWLAEKDDWERLAPIMAGAPALYAASERLAEKLEGSGMKVVDGRIILEVRDVAEFLDTLDEIRASAPRIPPPEENSGTEIEQAASSRYLR
jgi:hypothetical protein